VVPGFTVTTVHGGVYGTAAGKPAAVTGGKLTALPDGTLIPVGSGGGHLMVISQGRLHALIHA